MPGKWMQAARERMKKKGTEGKLTRAAHAAGYKSGLAYAHHVKAHPDRYSGEKREEANFAINANK